ncbi:antiporter [Peptoniphilus equinus]|uniref:Antiporter n=1 Tax=Peptoniphilus equinus TaxID=3016343 RepID=A0ABY7QUP5_9FIRM|nr:antiporter [Peptoniphilus equinus]WBW49898.1 antiporter [Peptoniphilus equinus]
MSTTLAIFLFMAVGYVVGSINFFGIKLGASAILIAALVGGHFGVEIPAILGSIGLVLFLAPIGLMAGRTFVSNVKRNGVSFLLIAILTCVIGGAMIVFSTKVLGIPLELSLGLGTGALTSTAMLGTVTSLTPSPLPGVGYGIAYVFGVMGVVLMVQLIPRILNADIAAENEKLSFPESRKATIAEDLKKLKNFEPYGLFGIACAIVIGVLIGGIKIPVGDTMVISLGDGGGAIIAGIILGHFGHIGPINFTYDHKNMQLVRDIGLALFLMRSGANAGAGFIEVVSEYGIVLFFAGVLITFVSAFVSFLMAYFVFKLPLFGALGTTTGSMTSAPSLGALLDVTKDERVSSYYAATQPVATIFLVFMPQIIWLLFGPR